MNIAANVNTYSASVSATTGLLTITNCWIHAISCYRCTIHKHGLGTCILSRIP
jgi:hypothetical protein